MTHATSQQVFPSLAYENAEAAMEWLRQAFGFQQVRVVPGEGGGVLHAELRTSEGDIIMLLSTRHSTRRSRSPRSLGGTAQSVYLVVADVDCVHAQAVAAGAEVFSAPRDTGHGREFCCLDPEGHIWTFGTYQPRITAA